MVQSGGIGARHRHLGVVESRQVERMHDCLLEMKLVTLDKRALNPSNPDSWSISREASDQTAQVPRKPKSEYSNPWGQTAITPTKAAHHESPAGSADWMMVDIESFASLDNSERAPDAKSGPPPPPPPPPPSGSKPPPPPPPGKKAEGTASKTRQIFWTTIPPAKLPGTLWQQGSGMGPVCIDIGSLKKW